MIYLQMRRIEEMRKDKVDEHILEFLRKDSRESFVEIGKKLKLSESAIRHRVKNMVDNGAITKFTVEEEGVNRRRSFWYQLIHQLIHQRFFKTHKTQRDKKNL